MPLTVKRIQFEGEPFERKEGDSDPFVDILIQENPPGSGTFQPFNLTGYTVRFEASTLAMLPLFAGTAAILDAVGGEVSYTPVAGDIAAMAVPAGELAEDYCAVWRLSKAGTQLTIPRGDKVRRIIVGKKLE